MHSDIYIHPTRFTSFIYLWIMRHKKFFSYVCVSNTTRIPSVIQLTFDNLLGLNDYCQDFIALVKVLTHQWTFLMDSLSYKMLHNKYYLYRKLLCRRCQV